MATCSYCDSWIIFGGVKEDDLHFCNKRCYENGYPLIVAQNIPQEIVTKNTIKLHQGICPKCKGEGPIDVHTSHQIYSLLLFTSYKSNPIICCRSCGIKSQLTNLFGSMILGWWGIPWGILMTPVQMIKNIAGMIKGPDPSTPSDQLYGMVSLLIA